MGREEVYPPSLLTLKSRLIYLQTFLFAGLSLLVGTKGLSFCPSSSGDDSSSVPHSLEELGGRCQLSLFLQQHPLPRSPLGSSGPAPLLAPGLPSPRGPTTTAPLHKNLPSLPTRHQH